MTRLASLQITGFRGIPQLSLPIDCGSLILGGANGTGKSGCVDAIEFLYTGEVSTLSGTYGLSLKQHGPHIHVDPNETQVSAEFDDPSGMITRRLQGPMTVPVSLETHLARGSQLSFILRRTQLQQFIHARPADRYRSLADLIGAESLERTGNGLKKARDLAEREVQQLQVQQAQIERQLSERQDDDAFDLDPVRLANDELEGLGVQTHRFTTIEDADAIRAAVLRAMASRRPDPRHEARARLSEELRRGLRRSVLAHAADNYLSLLDTDAASNQAHLAELLGLLRRGREYAARTSTGHCPLCEQEVEDRRLLGRLVDRVGQLEEVSLREQRLKQARDELSAALHNVVTRVSNLEPLAVAAGIRTPGESVLNAISMLTESVLSGTLSESAEMSRRVEESLTRWESWSEQTSNEIERELTVEPSDDGEAQKAGAVLDVVERATSRHTGMERDRLERARLLDESARLVALSSRAERVFHLADTAYQTFNTVKNNEIQRIYDELETDLARMYNSLHPGEGHGTVAIAMDPRKRGSSDLKMGFYGRGGDDPRAFASEGHLDSLGLCIFLASARRFNGDWPLLVLDDVVTSVDATHKKRVAQMLFDEFGDRQIVVTTHDARWFLDLKRAQEEAGCRAHSAVIESWSLEEGPRVRLDAS